jgi:hypothetical protein
MTFTDVVQHERGFSHHYNNQHAQAQDKLNSLNLFIVAMHQGRRLAGTIKIGNLSREGIPQILTMLACKHGKYTILTMLACKHGKYTVMKLLPSRARL